MAIKSIKRNTLTLLALLLAAHIARLYQIVFSLPQGSSGLQNKQTNVVQDQPMTKGVRSSFIGNNSPEQKQYATGKPNFIVLLTCSEGFWDMWLNWLIFFEKLRIPNLPVHLFPEDTLTHLKCLQLVEDAKAANSSVYHADLTCLSWGSVFSQDSATDSINAMGFNDQGYKEMMGHRPAIVQRELEMGYDVIFSDADVIWKKNPLPYFEDDFVADREDGEKVHIWAQGDGIGMENIKEVCPGFMIYRSCPETIALVDEWRRRLDGKAERNQIPFNNVLEMAATQGLKFTDSGSPTSSLLQSDHYVRRGRRGRLVRRERLVRRVRIISKILPVKLFVNGHLYFTNKNFTDEDRANAVVVHNNWIIGYDEKLQRLKNYQLWDLDIVDKSSKGEAVNKK